MRVVYNVMYIIVLYIIVHCYFIKNKEGYPTYQSIIGNIYSIFNLNNIEVEVKLLKNMLILNLIEEHDIPYIFKLDNLTKFQKLN